MQVIITKSHRLRHYGEMQNAMAYAKRHGGTIETAKGVYAKFAPSGLLIYLKRDCYENIY